MNQHFATLVAMLAHSALLVLGEGKALGEGKPPEPDLAEARSLIDILAMLAEKTKGNLADDEQNYLSGVLYDLRMRYVRASSGAKGGPG